MVDTFAILNNRIKALGQSGATRAANVEEHLSMHFAVAVSCPPSTVLHVRGGNVWEGSAWIGPGAGYYIEGYSADFADPDTIDGYEGNFANAGYYIGIIFGREFYGWDHYAIGGDAEFATAAEAETYIEDTALLNHPWQPGYVVDGSGGLPLCGLVLRNDGRTGVAGAVLPIDRVNRERSYYWKDLRPRHYTLYSGPE